MTMSGNCAQKFEFVVTLEDNKKKTRIYSIIIYWNIIVFLIINTDKKRESDMYCHGDIPPELKNRNI